MPAAIREALERGDEAAFEQALQALSPEEQKAVVEAMRLLQVQQEEEEETEEDVGEVDEAAVVRQFEPLLQAIAAVATGSRG